MPAHFAEAAEPPSHHTAAARCMQRGWLLAWLCCLLAAAGCTRAFYRQQADGEAYEIIGRGAQDPRWNLQRYFIQPDPRSRFYDPNCPDYEPMPPDDPTAHQLMHCVNCKKGWPCWHDNGDTPYVQNPAYLNYLPFDEAGAIVLDLETVAQIAAINNRDYQLNLEEMYLSALDVSFERFRFDTQFFGGNDTFFTTQGNRTNTGGFRNSSSELRNLTDFEARKLFTTGGTFFAGLANTFVWQFSGPDTYTANTLLNFTLIQPLLRAGGRQVVMERLTRTERNMLGNIRAMERYRQEFYSNLAFGRNPGQGPRRQGGVFGGSGLEGFSGVGAGGFGQVGNTIGGGAGGGGAGGGAAAAGGGFAGGAGAGTAGGFLGLLQRDRQIQNQRANVQGLRRSLELLEALYQANRIDRFQVDQARQALFNTQSQLLIAEASYKSALDEYKFTLGLPPNLEIKIKDDRLNRFELLSVDMIDLQNDARVMEARLSLFPAKEEAVCFNPPLVTLETNRLEGIKPELIGRLLLERLPDHEAYYTQIMLQHDQNGDHMLQANERPANMKQVKVFMFDGEPVVRQKELLEWLADPCMASDRENDSVDLKVLEKGGVLYRLRRAVDAAAMFPNAIRWANERIYPQANALLPLANDATEDLRKSAGDRRNQLYQLGEKIKEETQSSSEADQSDLPPHCQKLAAGKVDSRAFDLAAFNVRLRTIGEEAREVNRVMEEETRELDRLSAFFVGRGPDVPAQVAIRSLVRKWAAIDKADPDAVSRFAAELADFEAELDAVRCEIITLARTANNIGLVHAAARLDEVTLIPIDIEPPQAVRIAEVNRLDWMNARAGLVDQWRLIEFNANALESSLNLILEGDIDTLGDNPFRFRAPTGRLRAGVQFDAPITRLAERNLYRQALIEYQQARRNYMAFEDTIYRGLRNTLRTVELNKLNFELRRTAVRIALDQVILAALRLQEPPRPTAPGALGGPAALGATTVRDLVSSLGDLLVVQNDYLSVWVNYEQQRMELDLALGTMRIDDRGLWIDPGPIDGKKIGLGQGNCDVPAEKTPTPELLEPPEPNLGPTLPEQTTRTEPDDRRSLGIQPVSSATAHSNGGSKTNDSIDGLQTRPTTERSSLPEPPVLRLKAQPVKKTTSSWRPSGAAGE